MTLNLNKGPNYPIPMMLLPKFDWTGPVVLKQKILEFRQHIFNHFVINSTWNNWTLPYNRLEFPLHKDALCQADISPVFWKRFSNIVNVFLLFCKYMYLPLEKEWKIHLNNLNSVNPRMFGLNWSNGYVEDEKVKSFSTRRPTTATTTTTTMDNGQISNLVWYDVSDVAWPNICTT